MIARFCLILCLLATPGWAVEPSEMLSDPALEARARSLSAGLRCPVCQNESIDESNAQLASDLRIVLRERLVAGDSDAEAVDFLVARYGEFILLNPTRNGANALLWLAGPLLFLVALFIGWIAIRPRKPQLETLSDDEESRLRDILKS